MLVMKESVWSLKETNKQHNIYFQICPQVLKKVNEGQAEDYF